MFDEGKGLSTAEQAYDHTAIINAVRQEVDAWRKLPPAQWRVTPETARLLEHWRNQKFTAIRPFFCQVEAAETAIWLTEVAPKFTRGFLLVAPGLTIKDRLRVLLPNDADSYYARPRDMLPDLDKAKIVITNYHVFSTVTQGDFKGLGKLKDAYGKQFTSGVLLYDGESILPFGERLFAVPLRVLVPGI